MKVYSCSTNREDSGPGLDFISIPIEDRFIWKMKYAKLCDSATLSAYLGKWIWLFS